MAKGSYNISVSRDSNLVENRKKKNEAELENQECLNSCLSPAFLRSLSLHDRPRSSLVPINKELRKSRYKTLVSSLDNIASNPSSSTEERSESSAHRGFKSVGIGAETGVNPESSIYDASLSAAHQQTGSRFEEKYPRFNVESENLLEKTVVILRTLDEDISESLTNLTKPESIALESVMEIYRNKGKSTAGSSAGSEIDFLTESSSQHIYENWQPIQLRPKDVHAHSTPRRLHNLQAQSHRQSPKNLLAPSAQQSPKDLLVHSAQETLNFESLMSSDSGNTQFPIKPDSDDVRSVEESPRNLQSSPKTTLHDTAKTESFIEFDLPSDHEQCIKIIGALQNRCLEYREMVQDIAVSALEECVNFSEFSVSRILDFRKQFGSQKRNFRDFKELCCKSVVFGPDSLPIDERVTEVIQSFYLKLLQEENETFMVRLEFGLKMAEMYSKMLKFETEGQKTITTLEKEILYLKKTSVGFKV